MSLSEVLHSDVYETEIDLSSIVINASSSVAGEVIVSSQGSTSLRNYTSWTDFTNAFGQANPQISMTGYTVKDYFREGNNLYAARAVGTGALYAGIALNRNADGSLTLSPITGGIVDPTLPSWNTYATSPAQCVGIFYPYNGQGSFANNYAVSITTPDPSVPTNPQISTAATGGQLVAGTYTYTITSVGPNGETLASTPVTVVTSGTSTGVNTITWNLMPNAYGYNIYGRVAGAGYGLLTTIGQGTNTFSDTGALIPDTAVQAPTTAPKASTIFTVNIFDTTQSTSTPLENWNVSFDDETDGTGTTTEIEHRINAFSKMLQYSSNLPSVLGTVSPSAVAMTNLAGGASGAAPTSYAIAALYQQFSNRNIIPVNMLINGGVTDPVTQTAMDSLVQSRGECIALLDTPSDAQQTQQAINYRNNVLNINSSYSALFCPDVYEADEVLQRSLFVPFSGWAAALCARTDRIANPAFSIAGLNRGLLDILGTRYSYSDPSMDLLSKAQVNYTRTMIGDGTALWSQRTLQSKASALSWLSVRRISNTIKIAMYNAGLYYLQEQNDDFTVRGMLKTFDSYLDRMVTARALYDYAIVSDSRNNSTDDEIAGIRNVLIILYPEIPIDRLNLAFAISKQGVTVTEAVQSVAQS